MRGQAREGAHLLAPGSPDPRGSHCRRIAPHNVPRDPRCTLMESEDLRVPLPQMVAPGLQQASSPLVCSTTNLPAGSGRILPGYVGGIFYNPSQPPFRPTFIPPVGLSPRAPKLAHEFGVRT